MNFFDVLSLLGGLAMFLYGMRLMGESLKENSSGALKRVMEKVTDNALKAFVLGIAVTALIQSSTATIVITAGLVGAGILTLRQSLGIIVGANVGTTVTGQIIRLLDVNASETSLLRFFQPSTLAPVALIVGIVLIMTGILKNSRSIGNIAVGFGILFSGLLNMTSAVNALQRSGMVEQMFAGLGDNHVLGYLTGAAVAFVLQSSSAAVGILQAFSASGFLTFKAIYTVIVGIYLGDCVTTAIVIYIGANREARRVAVVNILYNLSKTALVLLAVTVIHRLGLLDGLWDAVVNSGMIANTNTVFNLVCALCLLPALRVYERLSDRIVGGKKKEEEDPHGELVKALNPVFFTTPALAFRSCYNVLLTMFRLSRENLEKAQKQLVAYDPQLQEDIVSRELQVDRLTDNLSRYLVEMLPHVRGEDHISIMNQYYKLTTEFERLGDQAVNIADIAYKLSENSTGFSETCQKEIAVLRALLRDILDDAEKAFSERSEEAASGIEPKVHVVSDLINEMTQNHFSRMSAGECSLLADAAFSNLMAEYKRVAGTCSNTGIATLVRIHPELASREHLFLETLDKSGNAEYRAVLERTHKEYFGRLSEAEAAADASRPQPEEA